MGIFTKENYNGIEALGTEDQLRDLYSIRELVSAPTGVSMAETNPDRWKVWKLRNQDGQNSCVFHARAKMAGILREKLTGEFVEYSAADYNKRSNAPGPGAFPVEALDLMRKEGIGLEALEPTYEISDADLTKMVQTRFQKDVAEVSKLDKYFALPEYSFDFLISTLKATDKPIILGFFATRSEWNRDVPKIIEDGLTEFEAQVRHEVCATPNFGIWDGQEGFTIEDSWGTTGINGAGVRFITREFFENRNYIGGLVPTTFKTYEDIGVDPAKPHIKLERQLDRGDTGPDVLALQQVYKYEGLFPANHAGSEYFGPITEDSTKQYQAKHGIVSEGTPSTTGYGRVGPSTLAHINSNYK